MPPLGYNELRVIILQIRTKTHHSMSMRVKYGVSFVCPWSDLYPALVIVTP